MKISIIAAIGKNRELGKNNQLLWHIPEDFKRFKTLTTGHPVIMGQKTYESINRPLPNRLNIIVTRDNKFKAEGTIITYSLKNAIEKAKNANMGEIFIIGGASIYHQTIGLADKLYLTIINADFPDADVFFPDYSQFKKVLYKKASRDKNFSYTFYELER